MQKFESHLVSIQKVPQLPGSYVFDNQTNTIRISNERLSWSLVLGHLTYMTYRFIWLVFGLVSIGIFLAIRRLQGLKTFHIGKLNYLFLFWLPSLFPALMFYSETRFKIVQELFLVPLIGFIWSYYLDVKKKSLTSEII
jgi:hypothetical protein